MPKRKRNIIHQRYATGDKQGQCKNNCTGCVHQRYASGCCKKDCTGCTFASNSRGSVTVLKKQTKTFRANKLKGWTIDDSGSQRVYISPNGDRSTALMLAAAGSIDSICPTSADGSIDFAHMTEHQQFKHLESLSSTTSSLTADQDGSFSNHQSTDHCNACDGQHRAHTCGYKGQNKTTFMSDNASLVQQYQPDPNVQRERRSKKAADVSSNSFSKSKSSKNSKSSNFQSSSSSSSSTNQLINYRLQPSQPSQPPQPPQPSQPSQPPLLPQNQKDTTAQTSSSTLSIKLYRCKHCEFESKEKKICSNPSDKHQKNCPRHLTNKNIDTKSKTTSVQKQKQIRYTDEENQALVEGHMQFGTNWSDTLVKYRDVFHPCRGNASLSNRYNYIVKNENALFVSRLIFLLALLSSNLFHCFCHVLFLFQTPPNKSFVFF